MKLKSILIVVAVLAVLSAAAFLVRRPAPPPAGDARINQPLVNRSAVDQAAKLRLSDQGKSVILARQSDGTWRVNTYHDLPADFQKLSGFVNNLVEAKLQRLVTTNADRIARLEFKDTKIDLLDGSDKEVFSVTLGKNPETGGGRFVRFGTEAKAYLASLSAWLDTESKNWANAELLNIKAEDLAKVEMPFAEGGPVTVTRAKKEDPWTSDKTPSGQQVKADKIMSVISSVGNLRFSETTATDDAGIAVAKANLRTFKLTTFDNKTITVAMGRKPEEKKLKPPAPTADGKTGPAALGSVADLAKKDSAAQEGEKKADGEKKAEEAKPLAPEYETIPAGPVFVFATHSDAAAPINALMQKRAFQIAEYTFTGLPQKAEELFEAAPPPPAAPAAATPAPAAPAKPAEAAKKS